MRVSDVENYARELGFKFPVAIDRGWRTLNEWWPKERDRRLTSVSFLIDRNGTVRYVHSGGAYKKGDDAYAELKQQIESLLGKQPGERWHFVVPREARRPFFARCVGSRIATLHHRTSVQGIRQGDARIWREF